MKLRVYESNYDDYKSQEQFDKTQEWTESLPSCSIEFTIISYNGYPEYILKKDYMDIYDGSYEAFGIVRHSGWKDDVIDMIFYADNDINKVYNIIKKDNIIGYCEYSIYMSRKMEPIDEDYDFDLWETVIDIDYQPITEDYVRSELKYYEKVQ